MSLKSLHSHHCVITGYSDDITEIEIFDDEGHSLYADEFGVVKTFDFKYFTVMSAFESKGGWSIKIGNVQEDLIQKDFAGIPENFDSMFEFDLRINARGYAMELTVYSKYPIVIKDVWGDTTSAISRDLESFMDMEDRDRVIGILKQHGVLS